MWELDQDIINDYILYLRDSNNINLTTLNNKLRDLRAFIYYAQGRGWCSVDLKIKLIKVDEPDIIPLEDYQLREIYDACKGRNKALDRIRDYTIMRLMEDTGIRLTECMTLELNRLNVRDGIIKLNRTKNKKTREIYLTPAMRKELNLYLEARQRYLVSEGLENKKDVWIATNSPSKGKAVAARTIQGKIQEYGQLAGIPVRVSPHTFRHTFARNYIVAGGDMYTLKELLGHSTLEMVLRYVRLFGKDKQNNYLKVMEKREKNKKNNRRK